MRVERLVVRRMLRWVMRRSNRICFVRSVVYDTNACPSVLRGSRLVTRKSYASIAAFGNWSLLTSTSVLQLAIPS